LAKKKETIKSMPDVFELPVSKLIVDGEDRVIPMSRMESLLNKVEVKGRLDDGWNHIFSNKKICVFGGTGTIGQLIVEYLLNSGSTIIRVFSNDENSLWECQKKWGSDKVRYLLGDIRDYHRVLMALNGIDFVFNCAAIKHVPFAEYNPIEAVQTNIIGLDNIIRASIQCNVNRLLQISTDKAVEPTTIMGCTKMIGERLVQMRWAQNPWLRMVIVRLGNVYGSRGSIIELARKLRAENKPITVTNLDMERYFMEPQKVVDFIIEAFNNGKRGEIWVPKLHPESLMKVISREVGNKYPIEIIGKRKGEKIHEKLRTDYELSISSEDNKPYWIIKNEYQVL
jgi:FlaA1/EpsC-like NDP-sugar epimerase